jgi:hypothetical protein
MRTGGSLRQIEVGDERRFAGDARLHAGRQRHVTQVVLGHIQLIAPSANLLQMEGPR